MLYEVITLFPDITYSFYDVWANLYRIPFERIPLNGRFEIEKEGYFRENGGIIFPNPNAPTGVLLPLAEIEAIIERNRITSYNVCYTKLLWFKASGCQTAFSGASCLKKQSGIFDRTNPVGKPISDKTALFTFLGLARIKS